MKKVIAMLAALVLLVVFTAVTASASGEDALTDEEKMDALIQSMYDKYAEEGYTEVPYSAAKARASIDVPPEVLKLAYSDLDSASPEEMVKILEARNQVAYSAGGWCADGAFMTTGDPQTKTWHRLPYFSELFPGWDMPCDDPAAQVAKMLKEKEKTDVPAAPAKEVADKIVTAGVSSAIPAALAAIA